MDNVHVTSSEIGDYVYCPRGWWLKQNRAYITTPQMLRGTKAHNHLSFQLDSLGIRKLIIAALVILIFIMLVIILLSSFLAQS